MEEDINTVLGQVPPMVRERGSSRERLEALWRIMGWRRCGMQTRVAGDLAQRWQQCGQSPRLPADDPRQAAKRLDRMLSGEISLSLDMSMELIEVLPEPFRAAARVLVFPIRITPCDTDLMAAVELDEQHSSVSDRIRFMLARTQGEGMSVEELRYMAQQFDQDAESCAAVARALRGLATQKYEQGGGAA